MIFPSKKDEDLRVQVCRDLIKEVECASGVLLEMLDGADHGVSYLCFIKEMSSRANATACRMGDFLEWLETCLIIKVIRHDDPFASLIVLNTD